MDWITDTSELKTKHYKTDKRLKDRARIHQYSTSKYNWFHWLFNQMTIPKRSRILELGCGNGFLWERNKERTSPEWELILSDISPGMVEAAQAKLCSSSIHKEFLVCDAAEIPFAKKSFDIVIANHMLYHMDDLEQVLSEIRRVLTTKGVLYASTIGKGHLKELRSWVQAIEPRVDFATEKSAENFGLENGKDVLSTYFEKVDVAIYEDSLLVPAVDPIVDYVLSVGNAKTLLSGAKLDHFFRYLENELAKQGTITISKSSGIFKATRCAPRQIKAFFRSWE